MLVSQLTNMYQGLHNETDLEVILEVKYFCSLIRRIDYLYYKSYIE